MNAPVDNAEFEIVKRPVYRWHAIAGLALFHGYRKGVELGVSGGRFTTFLCASIHDMEMTAVDLWSEQPDNLAPGGQTYLSSEGWKHEAAYENFKQTCQTFFKERVTILRMSTVEAAKHIEDGSMDFAFIDADHSYNGCKADIEAWLPKIRKNGMLCGHDYHWPTVKQAVDEKFNRVVLGPDHIWIRHLK